MFKRSLFDDDDDEGPLLPPKKLVDGEMDITPMIDVTFQLLIFFMVGSTMQEPERVDLPPARLGRGVEDRDAGLIEITRQPGGGKDTFQIRVGNRTTDVDGVRRFVAERVRQNKTQFIIKADRFLSHGTVQEVARAVREIEGARFYIGIADKPPP